MLLLALTSTLGFDVPFSKGPKIKPFKTPLDKVSEGPMVFTVKEKLLSISGEDFNVYTHNDLAYTVTGTNKVPFGVGGVILDKLSLRDSGKAELCTIERRLISPTTAYDLYIKGDFYGKIERTFNPLKKVRTNNSEDVERERSNKHYERSIILT
ncbi:hypothetical protein TL16_g09340 [Triparma laevis f. inornata]|uniref:Uncharacterized protein n=1 Tax=Triparma laevis f. inornata TaxID=1714386 RepID=A0A9W7BAP4_9STRA|nr:hypothetical protein TL16_g09340 [Triparma laevis f. inornata]